MSEMFPPIFKSLASKIKPGEVSVAPCGSGDFWKKCHGERAGNKNWPLKCPKLRDLKKNKNRQNFAGKFPSLVCLVWFYENEAY